jgi:hypothetical protein
MLNLDKLDTIDWPTLKTAYGTADALPLALRLHIYATSPRFYASSGKRSWGSLKDNICASRSGS